MLGTDHRRQEGIGVALTLADRVLTPETDLHLARILGTFPMKGESTNAEEMIHGRAECLNAFSLRQTVGVEPDQRLNARMNERVSE